MAKRRLPWQRLSDNDSVRPGGRGYLPGMDPAVGAMGRAGLREAVATQSLDTAQAEVRNLVAPLLAAQDVQAPGRVGGRTGGEAGRCASARSYTTS